jgi:hypothetical protein
MSLLQEINCYFRKENSNIVIDMIGPKYETIEKDLFFYPVHIVNSDKATEKVFHTHHPKVNKKYNNYLIFNKGTIYIRYSSVE